MIRDWQHLVFESKNGKDTLVSVSPNGINCSVSFSNKTFGQLNTDKYLYLKTFVVLWTKGKIKRSNLLK